MTKYTDWMALQAILSEEIDAYFSALEKQPPELRCYALVDAGQVPEFQDAFLDNLRIAHAKLFAGTRENKIAQYGPILIALHRHASSNRPPVAQLLASMQYGWTVTWLTSPLELAPLARHLAGHLNGILDDGQEALIRYYDPRNLAPFLDHMEPKTRAALLAPVTTWTYWNRALVLQTISGPGRTEVADHQRTHITSATKDAMAAAAIPDLIMSKLLSDSDTDAYADWLPHTLYRQVAALIAEARAYGLQEFADLYLFVTLALTVHPAFHTLLPAFVNEQRQIAAGETAMLDVVLAVTDDEWNDVSDAGHDLRARLCGTAYATFMNEKSTG